MILIKGATGDVGRAVVCRLASLGHDVVATVRDVQAASRRLPPGIALRVADYEDASALKRALAGSDDMVLISSEGDASAVISFFEQRPGVRIAGPARRSVSGTAPEQAFLNLPYPVGYASCITVIDHTWSWRRGDALHIAAIRRCLRYATL